MYIYAIEDEFFTPESRRWAAQNIFGVEPIDMEGGHFPMLERPSELADVLVASLASSTDGGVRDNARADEAEVIGGRLRFSAPGRHR